MICPHCSIGIRFDPTHIGPVHTSGVAGAKDGYDTVQGFCPECQQFIVLLRYGTYYQHNFDDPDSRELMPTSEQVIYPASPPRRPLPPEVPEPYRTDFGEACAVMTLSPKASAAITRRLLQHVLRDELKIVHKTLDKEISEFIARPNVPSHLSQAVDAIRNVGNFAAHPMKNTSTGEVLEVEPGEASWLIDVLESLFDHVFVQPKRLAARKAALDAKLASAGKPPTK